MLDSTRRALRTLYQGVLALVVGVPTLVPLFDTYVAPHMSGGEKYVAFGATLLAAVAVVAKVVNNLEERGLIPAYLKGDKPAAPVDPAPVDPVPVVVPDPAPADAAPADAAAPVDPTAPVAETAP